MPKTGSGMPLPFETAVPPTPPSQIIHEVPVSPSIWSDNGGVGDDKQWDALSRNLRFSDAQEIPAQCTAPTPAPTPMKQIGRQPVNDDDDPNQLMSQLARLLETSPIGGVDDAVPDLIIRADEGKKESSMLQNFLTPHAEPPTPFTTPMKTLHSVNGTPSKVARDVFAMPPLVPFEEQGFVQQAPPPPPPLFNVHVPQQQVYHHPPPPVVMEPPPLLARQPRIATLTLQGPLVPVVVEFKNGRTLQFDAPSNINTLKDRTYVIVKGDRGEHVGKVHIDTGRTQYKQESQGQVLRVASQEELNQLAQHGAMEEEALATCYAKIQEAGLVMDLCYAEYQLDMKKLTFFYKSDARQDFRDLIRDLYKLYRARIWMEKLRD
eukprot:TRINITY_DN16402_c0_g1_i1.p1 TRINITY_DN16402_c0_g1~~TRINITY_DN16402_c0_g1_i1.p1  ORF type:complete len:377 (+),score=74.68 TRINITY_DN16402_c0_g1_i1:143-1273(+)